MLLMTWSVFLHPSYVNDLRFYESTLELLEHKLTIHRIPSFANVK